MRARRLRRREICARPGCRASRARHCRWRRPRRLCNPLLTLRNKLPPPPGKGQPVGSASRREHYSTQRQPADSIMHPALRSWRDELPSSFVRLLAYLGAIVLLSTAATYIVQSKKVTSAIAPAHEAEWIAVERPIPAFTLSIPEAADVPASYAILRHIFGGGRKDILTLGEEDSSAPFLQVEIYRPGNELDEFEPMLQAIADEAASLSPVDLRRELRATRH